MKRTIVAFLVCGLMASVSYAGMVSGSLAYSKSDGDEESPVDLSTVGTYAWAVFEAAQDVDEDGVYEPTDFMLGGPFIGFSATQSGGGGTAYGDFSPVDAIVETTNHEKPEYFSWTNGTNETEGATGGDTLRYHNPLGWASDYVAEIRGEVDGVPAMDDEYAQSLADYSLDPDYGFGVGTLVVPVPAGEGSVNVYFGHRRCTWINAATLLTDGEVWTSDLYPDAAGGSIGNKSNNVLTIDFNADVAQDLEITFTAQEVDSDTNRRFDIQAVSVVPEPATMSLLALGGLAALIRRKR